MSLEIMDADSYKVGHWEMVRPGTTHMQYHFIARGGPYEEIEFFGLQHYLMALQGNAISIEDLTESEMLINDHLGEGAFPKENWEYIRQLGYLPIRVKARPEGSICKPGEPLFTVENTDPKCFWLPGYLETYFERIWYPTLIATQSHDFFKMVKSFMEKSSDGDPLLAYRIHDFGGRSYTSPEAAAIGGLAHLAAGWRGTDTMGAIRCAFRSYGSRKVGESVKATEHSITGTWGPNRESQFLNHLFTKWPKGVLSIVSDTYNYWDFVLMLCTDFKDTILQRTDGPVVVRPDSGDAAEILPWTLNTLWDAFGGTVNSKGYKVLDPHVRIILGDGNKRETLPVHMQCVLDAGFSAENLVWGMGSGLIQKGLDRDILRVAYKGNSATINNVVEAVYKDPATDPGKKSIRGLINDLRLETVFENGKITKFQTIDEIRVRCTV